MAFDAGSAIGYYKLDNSQFVKAVNESTTANNKMNESMENSNKKSESMTGSFLKAGVALEAIKKGAQIMLDFGKSFVTSASNLENLNAEFSVMLGSAEKAKSLVGEIRKKGAATPFGTEDLAQAAKVLMQFGIEQENVIETMSMLGEVAGNSKERLNSLALVFGQISSAGKLQGQDLMQLINVGFNPLKIIADKTGESMASLRDKMSKGQISIEMVTDAFKSATSEGGLFYKNMQTQSQTLTGLWSTMQDEGNNIAATIGTGMLPILKDMIKETISLASSTNAYLQSAEGMQKTANIFSTISGVLAVGKGIFQEIANVLKDVLSKEIEVIKSSFDKLLKSGSNTFTIFDVLSVATKTLSTVISVATNVTGGLITGLIDLYNVAVNAAKVIGSVWDAMSGKGSWDAVQKNIDATKSAMKNLVINTVDNVKDVVSTIANGYIGLVTGSKDLSKEIEKNWNIAFSASQKYYKDQQNTAITTAGIIEQYANKTAVQLTDAQKKASEEFAKTQMSNREKAFYELNKQVEDYKKAGIEEVELTKWANDEKLKLNNKYNEEDQKNKSDHYKNIMQQAEQYASFALESAQKLVSIISDTMNSNYQNELDALQIKYDEQAALIEENQTTQSEQLQATYDADLEEIKSKLAKGIITQKQYDAQETALTKKKEADQKAIDEKAAADKAALDKKKLDEENEIKKKQFESNKAFAIANIWINMAIATMAAWAGFMASPGGTAGIVLGAVATALLLAAAIAETVVVSQQQFVPARAEGGDVNAGQPYEVGEMGREIFVPGISGTIINSATTRELLSTQGEKSIINNYAIDIHDNNITDKLTLDEITDYVIDEIGRRVG